MTARRGAYLYEVTDGTPRRPAGHIGFFASRELAQEARCKRCRMGGYIRRFYTTDPELQASAEREACS